MKLTFSILESRALFASSFFGTSPSVFLSSSRREGEIVKKSQPASSKISPVLRNEAPILASPFVERNTHDDSLVAVLFVVIEDLLDGNDTWILSTLEVFLLICFVPIISKDFGRNSKPIKDTSYKR